MGKGANMTANSGQKHDEKDDDVNEVNDDDHDAPLKVSRTKRKHVLNED